MTKLLLMCRQIHRWLVLVTTLLAVTMSLTGIALKYYVTTLNIFPNLDPTQLRYLHNQLTPYISIALGLMALTGLGLYLLPPLIGRQARKRLANSQTNPPT